jgi:hypothetical protein
LSKIVTTIHADYKDFKLNNVQLWVKMAETFPEVAMALTLNQVREQYPELSGTSDEVLVNFLHKNYYSDIPLEDFSKAVGLTSGDEAGDFRSYVELPFLKGTAAIGGAVGYGLEASGIAPETGRSLQESHQRAEETLTERQSQQAREDAGKRLIDDEGNYGGYNAGTFAQQVFESAPGMLAMGMPGGLLARGATAGAKAVGVGSKAANTIGSALGFGASEGIFSGASNAEQIQQEIRNASFDKLVDHPAFIEAYHTETDPDAPQERRLEQARDILARKAGDEVFADTAVKTGGISTLTRGGIFGMMREGRTGGLLANAGKGMLKEGILQEAPQSALEQRTINQARLDYLDPNQDLNEGVLTAGIEGGLVGAAMGVAGGAGVRDIGKAETVDDAIAAAGEALKWQPPAAQIRPDAEAIIRNRSKPGLDLQAYLDQRTQDTGYTPELEAVPWETPSATVKPDADAFVANRTVPGKSLQSFLDEQTKGSGYVPGEAGQVWEAPNIEAVDQQAQRNRAFYEAEQAAIARKEAELDAMLSDPRLTPNQQKQYRKARVKLEEQKRQRAADFKSGIGYNIIPNQAGAVHNTQLRDQLQGLLARGRSNERTGSDAERNPATPDTSPTPTGTIESAQTTIESTAPGKPTPYTHADPDTGEKYRFLGDDRYQDAEGAAWSFSEGELEPLTTQDTTNAAQDIQPATQPQRIDDRIADPGTVGSVSGNDRNLPEQQQEPVQPAASGDDTGSGPLDSILTTKKQAWINARLKEQQIKPKSPGYGAKFKEAGEAYEQELNKALANAPFDVFANHPVNAGVPKGDMLKQAHEALRDEFGVADEVPKSTETIKQRSSNTGAWTVEQRKQNAANSFKESVIEQFGLSDDEAQKAFDYYLRNKLVKLNSGTGQFNLSDGRLWDASALKKAAKDQQKPDKQAKNKTAINDSDDLLTAIAKLGGLDAAEAKAQGIDPASFKLRGHGIKRVFNHGKNSKSYDSMAEALREQGFDVPMANDLVELVSGAVNQGNKVYTAKGAELQAEIMAQEHVSEQEAQHVLRIESLYEAAKQHDADFGTNYLEIILKLDDLSTDNLSEWEQDLEADRKARQQKTDSDSQTPVSGETELQSYTEQEIADREREQKQRDKQAQTDELKARQKEKADKEIDTLADEMLGNLDSGDVFSVNTAPNASGKDTEQTENKADLKQEDDIKFSKPKPESDTLKSTDTGDAFAQQILNKLAEEDEFFRFPISKSKDIAKLFKEIMPNARYVSYQENKGKNKDMPRHFFAIKGGGHFYVYETPDALWLDVSQMKTGMGGSAVYFAAGNYAHNTGKVFTGDPDGLTEDAVIRRTANMLSLALRFGKTDFMDAAKEQREGILEKGIAPLEWKGSNKDKINALIRTFLSNFQTQFPGIKNARYDFKTGQFLDGRARPLHREFFDAIREGLHSGGASAARAGAATTRQGILIQSLVSSESSERPGILEHVLHRSRALVNEGDLDRVFSSKNPPKGTSVDELRSWLPKRVNKLVEANKLHIVQSAREIPDNAQAFEAAGAEAFYKISTDELFMIADNITKENFKSVLNHELFHRLEFTDKRLREEIAFFDNALEKRFNLAAKGGGSKIEKAAYRRVMDANVQESDYLIEFKAYLVSEYSRDPDTFFGTIKKIIQDFIAAIRAAMIRVGVPVQMLTPADLTALAKYGARVKDGVSQSSNSDIHYSRAAQDSATVAAAKRKAGLGPKRTLAQAIQDIIGLGWSANAQALKERWQALKPQLEQGVFDKFLGIKLAEQEILGEVAHSQSGYIGARLSTGSSSTMQGLLLFGSPEWRDGIIQKKAESKGFAEILQPVKDDIENFTAWMVGRRADRLFREGKENNFTRAEIDALLALKQDSYQGVADDIAAMNKAVLDLAQESGLVDAQSRRLFEHSDYIPFFRLVEGVQKGPRNKQGLSHQTSGIKVLKGGENPLSDPLGNMMQNWAHLIDASMKNDALNKTLTNLEGSRFVEPIPRVEFKQAMIPKEQIRKLMQEAGLPDEIIDAMPGSLTSGIAKLWAMQAPTDPDVVRVMRDGKSEYFRVHDGMLLTSLTAVNQSQLGGIFKSMRYMKHLLTAAITADPTFMARNFIRDSMHSWTIAEEKGFKLGLDSFHGAIKSMKEEGGYVDMMFAGASFQGGYGNYNNPDSARESMDAALRRRGIHDIQGFHDSILDTPKKYWEMYRSVGDAIENANREAILENVKRSGAEKAQYLFEAKDIMDFSMQGSFTLIRAMSDMLPFFNARLVGLYRLAKAGKTEQARRLIIAKGLSISFMTLALLALNSDNEDYEALEDFDKDQYWHFFIGDQHYRIPKPFELGLIFGTVPERAARAMIGKDTLKDFGKRMAHGAGDTLAFNPVPQLFKPFVELYSNKNMFTGRPIEGMADEGKLPSARYNEYTSETMRVLSSVLPESLGASPKRLEHLMSGYLGAMGMYALGVSDMMVRSMADMPELPEQRIDRLPVIKGFYQEQPALHTKYGTQLYEMLSEVNQIHRTINAYKKEGNIEKARELLQENASKLRSRKALDKSSRSLSDIRKRIDAIYRSDLGAEEKRRRIDALMMQANKGVQRVVRATSPYFN